MVSHAKTILIAYNHVKTLDTGFMLLDKRKDRLVLYVRAGRELTACREHDAAMLLPTSAPCRERSKRDEKGAN